MSDRHNYLPQIMSFFAGDVEFAAAKNITDDGRGLMIRTGIDCLNWLRARNFSGENIYMRPIFAAEQCYLLLDDLSESQIEQQYNQPGRLIVETSSGNFQTWIRYADSLTDYEKKHLIAEAGADRAATPHRRWGRCPGFSNRKTKHIKPSGYYPERLFFVRLIQITDGYEPRPAFSAITTASPEKTTLSTLPPASKTAPARACSIARSYYRSALQRTAHPDLSSVDFSLAVCLLSYSYSLADIAATIIECSPNFVQRRKSPDYAMRTAMTAAQQRQK